MTLTDVHLTLLTISLPLRFWRYGPLSHIKLNEIQLNTIQPILQQIFINQTNRKSYTSIPKHSCQVVDIFFLITLFRQISSEKFSSTSILSNPPLSVVLNMSRSQGALWGKPKTYVSQSDCSKQPQLPCWELNVAPVGSFVSTDIYRWSYF